MQVVNFGEKFNSPIVLCLGFFGCMHTGHKKLLSEAQKITQQTGAKVALFTFSNNHLKVLGKDLLQLYTFTERLNIYKSLGVDVVLSTEFCEQFKNKSAMEFLQTLSTYDLRGVVCGFDYTCGCDRLGSQFVKNYFANLPVAVVDAVCEGSTKISTTYIRQLLADCQIAHANNLLSTPFFFDGIVVSGRGVGKRLGFATANIQVDEDKFLPVGVFCGETQIDGKSYKCLVNIGAKPTYGIENVTIEAHILGYEGNLYGSELRINLIRYLRPTQKFASQTELIQQLNKDKESCLND